MTIKKKFIYLFNNTTKCRGQCLDHIVVFGKLIFVVLGIWDGVVPYRVTDETDDKRLGITGRVVRSEILDISGVTYTKVNISNPDDETGWNKYEELYHDKIGDIITLLQNKIKEFNE